MTIVVVVAVAATLVAATNAARELRARRREEADAFAFLASDAVFRKHADASA